MRRRSCCLALVAALAALACLTTCGGHGFLAEPLSRNMYARIYDANPDYTPNQLSAGGVSAVSGGFTRLWPNGLYSVCGNAVSDPDPKRWMQPRPVQATYTAGSVIEISVSITADHKGRFAFRLCPSTAVTDSCLDGHWLTRADSVRPGDRYWYLTAKADGSARVYSRTTSEFTAPTYGLRYRLPSGVTCDNCVLQWWYATGNSCALPCVEEDPDWNPAAGPTSCDKLSQGICGTSTSVYPEEFWNCADIAIVAANGTTGTTSPSPSPSPAVAATPSPSPSPSPVAASPSPSPSPSPTSSGPCSTTGYCVGKADGLYANPCDGTCNTYITCSYGNTYVQSCSTGLVFNPAYKYCDWSYNYKCPISGGGSASPSPSPAATPSPSPSPIATPSPSPSPSPSATPSPSPSATPSPSPSPSSSPSPSPSGNTSSSGYKVVGYLENWRWYSNPNTQPPSLTAHTPKLTHINYAFASVSYSPALDSYYLDFTDTWADIGACLTGSCPSTCIALNATCPGSNLALAPTTKTASPAACPSGCYNPSGSSGYPRKCNTVAPDLSTPLRACGHYAYVQQFIKNSAPNVRVLISVGGWYDSNLFSLAASPKYRTRFVDSVFDFLDTFGFDGVDIDWEYPGFEHGGQPPYGMSDSGSAEDVRDCSAGGCTYTGRTADGSNFVGLLTEIRSRIPARRSQRGEPYLVTMAAPGGSDKIAKFDVAAVCSSLDWVNIMTYDLAGPWDSVTGHQSALAGSGALTIASIVQQYVSRGCPANKLVVGVPFYGRTFKGVAPGPNTALPGLGQPFSSSLTNQLGSAEAMPTQINVAAKGFRTYYDTASNASYAYDSASQIFITYDNEAAVGAKADYVKRLGLGGVMAWALGQETASLWSALTSGL